MEFPSVTRRSVGGQIILPSITVKYEQKLPVNADWYRISIAQPPTGAQRVMSTAQSKTQ